MKQLYILIPILLLSFASLAQPTLINQSWAHNSDTPNAIISFQASTFDQYGDLITTGNTYQVGQSVNFLVVKTDPSGDTLWQQSYNGAANSVDFATDVTAYGSYVYVTGVESDT